MKKNDTKTDKEFIKYLDENGNERHRHRIKTEKGQVVESLSHILTKNRDP